MDEHQIAEVRRLMGNLLHEHHPAKSGGYPSECLATVNYYTNSFSPLQVEEIVIPYLDKLLEKMKDDDCACYGKLCAFGEIVCANHGMVDSAGRYTLMLNEALNRRRHDDTRDYRQEMNEIFETKLPDNVRNQNNRGL